MTQEEWAAQKEKYVSRVKYLEGPHLTPNRAERRKIKVLERKVKKNAERTQRQEPVRASRIIQEARSPGASVGAAGSVVAPTGLFRRAFRYITSQSRSGHPAQEVG